MSFLEYEGFQSLTRKAKRHARDLVNEVKTHITQEIGKVMSEIEDLKTAVDQELADDAAQNQLLAERAATIADLEARLGEAQAAVEGAVAGEAAAQATLQDALSGVADAVTKLKSNDAPAEEPTV
jgi:hypothetical protein